MKRLPDGKSTFGDWFTTGDAKRLLKSAANAVLAKAKRERYSFTFMGFDANPPLHEETLREDIESRLKLYILENRRGVQETIRLHGPGAGRMLRNGFLQEWQDATRRPGDDRRRYLRKRILECMRADPRFLIKRGSGEGTVYTLEKEGRLVGGGAEDDLRCIPPPQAVSPSDLKRSETILGLAEHFWKEVSALWGGVPVWVPVGWLLRWIGLFVDTGRERRVEPLPDRPDPLESLPCERFALDSLPVDGEKVVTWAGECASLMSGKEAAALLLHLDHGLTLEATAGKMGLSGPSGPYHHFQGAVGKVKRFVRDLPWLSAPDLDEKAWGLFVHTLFSRLKKHLPQP